MQVQSKQKLVSKRVAGAAALALAAFSLGAVGEENRAQGDKRLLWGDTHVHTNISIDAYVNENFDVGPDVAYRFARGLPAIHPLHRGRVRLREPLDFMVVSDHAELIGVMRKMIEEGVDSTGLGLMDSLRARIGAWVVRRHLEKRTGREFFDRLKPVRADPREAAAEQFANREDLGGFPEMMSVQVGTWREIGEAADRNNIPGVFSAFIGWEWSSLPGTANLHRVVITDADGPQAARFQPFSSTNSPYPEDLWKWLDATSAEIGADFISIPHNSNLSRGYMFDDKRLRGEPFDREYAQLRARWETVAEATQVKGDSETHPSFSPDDPFADFEHFPFYLQSGFDPYAPQPGDFIRPALKRGMAMERELGLNPYRFGMIGSSDVHTGLASIAEDNFLGKMANASIPEEKRVNVVEGDERSYDGWNLSASGLAAVWAEENTRESILAAMRRREVYATTGPRIRLKFFAARNFEGVDPSAAGAGRKAARRGVPMGGELKGLRGGIEFLLIAEKDPSGANLDRVQVVKGWIDSAGVAREKVFNVVWAGERSLDGRGRLPAVGNTVDSKTALYRNTIGAAQLRARWRDPEFNPDHAAFYYARVLQIPTPRHSLYDALALGLDSAAGHPDSIQERAYSSPIWHSPR